MAAIRKGAWSAIVGTAIAFFVVSPVAAGGPAETAGAVQLELTAPGEVRISADGFLEERLILPTTAVAALAATPEGQWLRIAGWPVAVGDRRTVAIRRRSVYATEARIFVVSGQEARAIPRSKHVHFIGTVDGDPESGVLVILDPSTGGLTGMSLVDGTSHDLIPAAGGGAGEMLLLATHERLGNLDPDFACGEESLDASARPFPGFRAAETPAPATSGGSLEAVIGVDTDTELLSQKFSNNTSDAANYVADLFAAMNVMYERDLDLTLLQGTTFLRTGSDPYDVNSGSSAGTAELSEFGNYWKANYSSVDRALAAMLSGKSPSSNSASGIAWLGSLCSTSTGYSFSKVFKLNYLSGDAKLVGHEIGHNFGSPHTHCYDPPVDHCYNYGGCYAGPTSCPSGGPGTIMSYCHRIGCGKTANFHPTVVAHILQSEVNPATGVCVFEASNGADTIFEDGFDSGGLGGWSEVE
jgi:hypothetical protein